MKEFAKLAQWPAIFTMVALLTNDPYCAALLILPLAFQQDLSTVLRRRRVAVTWRGFQGRIDGAQSRLNRRRRRPPS
jgi:hypothetical protein